MQHRYVTHRPRPIVSYTSPSCVHIPPAVSISAAETSLPTNSAVGAVHDDHHANEEGRQTPEELRSASSDPDVEEQAPNNTSPSPSGSPPITVADELSLDSMQAGESEFTHKEDVIVAELDISSPSFQTPADVSRTIADIDETEALAGVLQDQMSPLQRDPQPYTATVTTLLSNIPEDEEFLHTHLQPGLVHESDEDGFPDFKLNAVTRVSAELLLDDETAEASTGVLLVECLEEPEPELPRFQWPPHDDEYIPEDRHSAETDVVGDPVDDKADATSSSDPCSPCDISYNGACLPIIVEPTEPIEKRIPWKLICCDMAEGGIAELNTKDHRLLAVRLALGTARSPSKSPFSPLYRERGLFKELCLGDGNSPDTLQPHQGEKGEWYEGAEMTNSDLTPYDKMESPCYPVFINPRGRYKWAESPVNDTLAQTPSTISPESDLATLHCGICSVDPCSGAATSSCGHIFCFK